VTSLTATEARQRLFSLLKSAARGHRVYRITHNDGDAVLLSQEDYESLLETLELLSTPGFARSIRQARREIDRGATYALEDVFPAP
jgi:antitoxin YefM